MRILFDHQIFQLQQFGGISRYFTEIIKRLAADPENTVDLGLRFSTNIHLSQSPFSSHFNEGECSASFLLPVNFKGKYRLHKGLTSIGLANHPEVLNKRFSLRLIKERNYDVFHPTWFDGYYFKHLKDRAFVITFHDMIHERYGGRYFKDHKAIIHAKHQCAKRAKRIIAVSETTKTDMVEIYGIEENKIDVIYHGCSFSPSVPPKQQHSAGEVFMLYVGDRNGYKNFKFFIEAISPLLSKKSGLKLVCAGSTPFRNEEELLFSRLGIRSQVHHEAIPSDEKLISLYQQAQCFVFPSLYEGFGLPVLEAFSCSCPAVLSHAAALKEIAGDAAAYFDPSDRESIYNTVRKTLEDLAYRKELILKGEKRLAFFSWDLCAQKTKAVYERATEK